MMNNQELAKKLVAILTFAIVATSIPAISFADFLNGDFETGDMTGWTITVGNLAEVTNQEVLEFDMNGDDPGGVSLAAQFAVGQSTNGDTEYRSVDITQELDLIAGKTYEIEFDWASHNYFFLDNFDGGVYDLIVDGNSLANWDTENIFLESTEWGTLNATYRADRTGAHTIGARISRRFRSTNNGTFILGQYLDNFSLTETVPEPTSMTVVALLGLCGMSRRRRG